MFNRFGGEIWLSTLIATGRVHSISVKIVNDIFAERIREAEREPTCDPRQAQPRPEVPASSQGRVKGVQHKKILANKLRQKARYLDKRCRRHDQDWQHARLRGLSDADMDWWRRTSSRLRQEATRQWTEAREESIKQAIKSGNPFKERDGSMYHPPGPRRLGTFEHSLKILLDRIKAGEVAWPPAQ